ncbi:nicotinamide riboside transporter PnuC [Alistipes sp.]|uniref:nicotinamide riboside transporter PnuC n=1 Tax=Alistipes sp. TaxID=1872444 RepID=UPI003AF0F5E9
MDWKLVLQIVGVALGLLYLWLEYRADIRLWAVGLVMPLVHGTLYLHAGLYADASMQGYYILAGLYGWIVWRAGRRSGRTEKHPTAQPAPGIAHTPLRLVPLLAAAAAGAFGLLYLLLVRFTDSTVPGWDGLSTALSMAAMWMLSRKYVEQWLVWLAVDGISVGLYLYKGIPLTAGLYLLYSALAVAGYLRWRRQVA